MDASWSGFADDMAVTHIGLNKARTGPLGPGPGTAMQLHLQLSQSKEDFDEAVGLGKLKQNASKRELVPGLLTQNEHRKFELMAKEGEGMVGPRARHLGGRYTYNGGNAAEVKHRIQALETGWAIMGDFWRSRNAWGLERALFIGIVQEAALSALETYALSAKEEKKIDVAIIKKLRGLMRGTAWWDEEAGHMRRMTGEEVLRH